MKLQNLVIGAIAVAALVLGYMAYTKPASLAGASGPTHTELQEFLGGFYRGDYFATTSALTSYTMSYKDITYGKGIVNITLSGGAATFTLPASSTLTGFITSPGQMFTQCYMPLSNKLTFSTGTGIDLMVASSTAGNPTINVGKVGCITFIRQADTDITAAVTQYI